MRLFVAISLNDEILTALEAVQQQLKNQSVRARYQRLENMHLTLVFIGETASISLVEEVVSEVMAETAIAPAEIALAGFGAFRGHRGDTIWVGVAGNPELTLLAETMKKRLREVGFEIERKSYCPHITVARDSRPDGAIGVEVPARSMQAKAVTLFRSDQVNGRRVYTEISSYSFSQY